MTEPKNKQQAARLEPADALLVAGFASVVTGVWWVLPAAALMVAGALLLAAGVWAAR